MVSKNKLQQFILASLFVFGMIVVCGAVSGCHPCVFIKCAGDEKPTLVPVVTHAEAFIGDGGKIYIDISEGKKISTKFNVISIEKIDSEKNIEVFWKIGVSDEKIDGGNKFPVRYGEIVGVKTIKSASELMNGNYAIKGEAMFFSEEGMYRRFIKGRFLYKNGEVINY